jgi:hypothetical protein
MKLESLQWKLWQLLLLIYLTSNGFQCGKALFFLDRLDRPVIL